MSEARDPAIKLFGRTIPVPESQAPAEPGENPDPAPAPATTPELAEDEKDICREVTDTEIKDAVPDVLEELDQGEPDSSCSLNNDNEAGHETPTQNDKATVDPKSEKDQTEADASDQEKLLKKPDKILPCPRCSSLDTKFCYYNNYNVNQPRHFCKNCQRYWTAGGTMRNVPVGAGRRKNKHSASHYRHIMMSSDGMPSTQVDAPDLAHQQDFSSALSSSTMPLKGNGTVLKFGPETPLCDSMASVLDLGDHKRNAATGSIACGESREEPSCASSVTAPKCVENECPGNGVPMEQNGMQDCSKGLTPMHHLQYYPGPPWAYPWNSGWNNVAAMAAGRSSSEMIYVPENGSPNPVPWNPPPMMAAPAFCAPTIPFPFMPASFWGCVSSWSSGTWNVPWVGSHGGLSPSTSNSACPGAGSPNLGKHSRDASLQGEEKTEKSLWVPKTLRIDDPEEAGKSSIWATLGIKPDEPITKGGIFKAFQYKKESMGHTSDATQTLHANPAALSRSQTFQERT